MAKLLSYPLEQLLKIVSSRLLKNTHLIRGSRGRGF
jgi:hypothetical protein